MAVPQERIQPEPAIDSVRLAVLSKRIESIAGKMQNTLLRTARSGVINNGRDSSCCILTADARLLAVGESLPIHVMVGSDMMAQSMMDFHPRLRRGDAFLHNSPYHGCSHAADLSVLVPVIDDGGVHRFTVLAKAHQADIGNSIPTTYHATARDVYEEGALIFAATKVQEKFEDIDDIIRMCMMRIRVPEQWRGDYLAGLGAARIGESNLLALGAEIGWDTLEAFVSAWFDYSEQRMIAGLGRLPSGRVTARSVHDPFPGTPPDGVPMDGTIVANDAGHVSGNLYVVGWSKRGPSGTIPTNGPESREVGGLLVKNLDTGKPGGDAIDALLGERGARVVDYDGYKIISAAEIARAPDGHPQEKFTRIEEMLAVVDGGAK